jgi:hypothetical protein
MRPPIESTHGSLPSIGCKGTSVPPSGRPTSRPASALGSWSSSQGAQCQGSRQATSAAINIPSPPQTPYHVYDDEDVDDLSNIFSSRYHKQESDSRQHQHSQEDAMTLSTQRHSTSAPSSVSPLQQRFLANTPLSPPSSLGFTFTSNISMSQPSEDRDSYAHFQTTMEQDCWKSVSTVRSTYFFDGIGRGGGFLAVSSHE